MVISQFLKKRTRHTAKLIVLFLFIASAGLSQNANYKYGEVVPADFNKEVSFEKDAKAVVIFDIGESSFHLDNDGFSLKFKRTKRINIKDKSMLDLAQIEIPIYADGYGKTERVTSVKGHTYNIEDGIIKEYKLDKSQIFNEKENDKWRSTKFALPNVKVGSIIEYEYIMESPFLFHLPEWRFQDKIPTLYSQYSAVIIPFYEYVFIAQGIRKFSYQNSQVNKGLPRRFNGVEYKEMVNTYAMKNVPSFKDESYITSIDDYIMKIEFQLATINYPSGATVEVMSTWPKLTSELLKHEKFGKYLKKCTKESDKIVGTIIKSSQSETEKIKAIVDYVKENFIWNGRNSKLASDSFKQFNDKKKGNAANINLFLLALLRSAGIEAEPLIISTRSNGKIKLDYPFEQFFNYVIVMVKVDEQVLLTDATESMLQYDRIPTRCLNDKGLIVGKGDVKWIDLSTKVHSAISTNIDVFIDENNSAHAETSIQSSEYEAYRFKKRYNDKDELLSEWALDNGFTDIYNVSTTGFEESEEKYHIEVEGSISIEEAGDMLLVKPFLEFPLQKNLLVQEKRTYPIDLVYGKTFYYNSSIRIPEGYKVLEMPDNFSINSDLALINMTCQKSNGNINTKAVFSLKKDTYQPHEYARIKFYFNKAVSKFNEQIVLTKDNIETKD
ncbi:MAG: transglutaminase domain-containing protein [Bacteroidota bacterium]